MSGKSGIGTELSNASASARRRVKVSAVSDTCGHSASASRNSGSTSSIVLMVGSRVRLGRSKTVWQQLPGDKSAWISHIDEQARHRVPPKGRGPSMVASPAAFSAPSLPCLNRKRAAGLHVIYACGEFLTATELGAL